VVVKIEGAEDSSSENSRVEPPPSKEWPVEMEASPFSFRFTGTSETEKCRTVDGLISFGYLRFLLIDSEEDSMTDKSLAERQAQMRERLASTKMKTHTSRIFVEEQPHAASTDVPRCRSRWLSELFGLHVTREAARTHEDPLSRVLFGDLQGIFENRPSGLAA
jgi:hypothetical protein